MQCFEREARKSFFTLRRGLEERARRRADERFAHAQNWLGALDDGISIERQTGEVQGIGFGDQLFQLRAIEEIDTAGAFDGNVDAAIGQQTLHRDFPARGERQFSQRAEL